jgi:Fungal specific transcription factor domain/Fungal Zn(2)-Cys(6) binuclear cluster domain/Zinc finger, C2H2 type
MHVCPDCGKDYHSQHSLNRHAQNHNRRKQHSCTVCGVAFGRKDLLSRHLRIHIAGTGTSRTSQRTPGLRRKRCHTACLRCAELRRKCTGTLPCTACRDADVSCEFPRLTGRISQVDGVTAGPSSPTASPLWARHDDNQTDALETLSFQPSSTQHADMAVVSDPFHLDHLGASGLSGDQDLVLEPPLPITALDNSGFLGNSGNVDLDIGQDFDELISWPWLHESLYLLAQESPQAIFSDTSAPVDRGSDSAGVESATVYSDVNGPQNIPAEEERFRGTGSPHRQPRAASARHKQREELIVTELVTHAALASLPITSPTDQGMYWSSMSPRVHEAFQLGSLFPSDALRAFVSLYFEHFGPLWPLLSRQNLELDSLHPLLFLVLTSIGAMYGGSSAIRYGTLLHNKVRTYLTVAFELDEDENDLMWLAQARLLTQVAALYFGQPRAFTYSQHLGALLVAQARRMNLFSGAQRERKLNHFNQLRNLSRDQERLAAWLHLEARRRLAFGIFRGDVYTSVLLGTMPLLSLEEIDLPFSTCDAMWRAEPMSTQACLHVIDHDRTPGAAFRASDVFRIALDPAESLPPLDPAGHELLLFGLQKAIWQFSHDHHTLARLTGREAYADQRPVFDNHAAAKFRVRNESISAPTAHDPETSRLEHSGRRMQKLFAEYGDLLSALTKWEKALPWVKSFANGTHDRSSLLSSLVLLHLGYLRLLAPIEEFHQVQYRLAEARLADADTLRSIELWANSSSAGPAAERACNIWALITRELQKEDRERVKCNLLAFIGLHHSAVLLWSYAGAHSGISTDLDQPCLPPQNDSTPGVPIIREESENILSSFADLFNRVSTGGWSSFAKAAS